MRYNGVIGRINHPKIWYGKMKATLGVIEPDVPVEPEEPTLDLEGYYTFTDIDDNTVEISGLTETGEVWVLESTDYKSVGEIIIPDRAKLNGVVKTVKGIGANAFESNTDIKTATFDKNIEYVGDKAFSGCTSLVTASFGVGLLRTGSRAFYNCTALSKADLPEGFTTLGASTFYGCSALQMNYLPSTLTSMGTFAFCGCTYVGINTVPRGITTIPAYAFYQCNSMYRFKVPDTVSRIDQSAFQNCLNLYTIVLHNKPLSLGNNAFSPETNTKSYLAECIYLGTEAERLSNITYDTNISTSGFGNLRWTYRGSVVEYDGLYYTYKDSIARVAGFVGDTVADLVIPASISIDGVDYPVKYIDVCAFIGDFKLKSVRLLGDSVIVDDYAFWRCNALESFVSDNAVGFEGWADDVGNTTLYGMMKGCNFGYCTSLTEFSVACCVDTNTKIPYRAFRDCDSLVEFIVPDGITIVGQEAFAGCNKLEKLVLPASLVTLYSCCVVGTSLNTVDYKGTDKADITFKNWGSYSNAGLTKFNAATWNIGVA